MITLGGHLSPCQILRRCAASAIWLRITYYINALKRGIYMNQNARTMSAYHPSGLMLACVDQYDLRSHLGRALVPETSMFHAIGRAIPDATVKFRPTQREGLGRVSGGAVLPRA